MSRHAVIGDAWIREAEEASKLVEDLETMIKGKSPEQRLIDFVRWKLLEVGPKLDRLESLLHNPPAKPILTDHDLDLRWNMLLDFQQRTKAVAISLYELQITKRPGNLPTPDTKESAKNLSSSDQGLMKITTSDPECGLLTPLVKKQSGSIDLKRWIRRACWIIGLILMVMAFLIFLAFLCAVV